MRNKKRKGRASTEPAAAACSAPSPSTRCSVAASALVSQHLLCSSFLQMPYLLLNPSLPEVRPRMYPVFFGESIEVSPEPVQEIRCNSEVKYDSEKHYRDDIFYGPIPTVTTYSETVIAAPNCTWRNYKSQLIFEPRQKPLRFQSTTIIFPKRAKNIYRTTLNYSLGCAKRWFASSVQLELCEETSPCVMYSETL
nr:refilin-A isoform X2 [Columba livia]